MALISIKVVASDTCLAGVFNAGVTVAIMLVAEFALVIITV